MTKGTHINCLRKNILEWIVVYKPLKGHCLCGLPCSFWERVIESMEIQASSYVRSAAELPMGRERTWWSNSCENIWRWLCLWWAAQQGLCASSVITALATQIGQMLSVFDLDTKVRPICGLRRDATCVGSNGLVLESVVRYRASQNWSPLCCLWGRGRLGLEQTFLATGTSLE